MAETNLETLVHRIEDGLHAEFPQSKSGIAYWYFYISDGAWYGAPVMMVIPEDHKYLRRVSREELIIHDCYDKIRDLKIDVACACNKHGKRRGLFRSENNILR